VPRLRLVLQLWRIEEKKVFFFEKKKQNAFVLSGVGQPDDTLQPVSLNGQTFSGSFFQKEPVLFS